MRDEPAGPQARTPSESDPLDVHQLAEALSRELGATPDAPTADAAWLERLGTEIADLASRLAHDADALAFECAVRRLAPSLPSRFAVYGAGTVGRWVATICAEAGRPAAAFIETDATGADVVDDLPVWRPAQARDEAIRCVVLGTRASAAAMQARLAEAYDGAPFDLRVESIPVAGVQPPRVPSVERALDVVRRGRTLSEYLWLLRRADERMDAALPINADARRLFHVDRYAFAARYAQGARVLDCASGTGYGSRWLATHGGASNVLGIEVDTDAVAYATRHHAVPGVSFRQGDACALDDLADGAFDLVASFETLEHVPDDRAMLAGFARVLAPSGACVISTPNDWPVETSPYHVRTYDIAAFRAVLEDYFSDVDVLGQWPPSPSAPGRIAPMTSDDTVPAECLVARCRGPRRR